MTATVENLLTICQRTLDPQARAITVHAGHDNTVALRAQTSTGTVIVKEHRGPDRHLREIHAYQQWTARLGSHAPQLLAVCDEPPAIIITALRGQPLNETMLDARDEAAAHQQAGELLCQLHQAAPARPEPDMTRWLADRGEYWLHQAMEFTSAACQAQIRAHLAALTELAPIPAVPCHRDYMPRNWILQPNRQLGIIDFEHTRYDLAARDLVRLATRIWPTRPDLEQAFLDGYGPLSAADRQVIDHCTDLDRLTAAVRARQRQCRPERLPTPATRHDRPRQHESRHDGHRL